MRHFIRSLYGSAKVSLYIYRAELSPAVVLVGKLPRTLTQIIFFVIVAKAAGGNYLGDYALIGNAVMSLVVPSVIMATVVIETEKWAGTLESLIAAPTHWLPLIVGRSFSTFIEAFLLSMPIIFVLVPLLGINLSPVNVLYSIPLVVLVIITTNILGLLLGAVSLSIRWGTLLSNVVCYFMMVVCGVNSPITYASPFLYKFSQFMPLTNGLEAIRYVLNGSTYIGVFPLIIREISTGVIYSLITYFLFNYQLISLRRSGKLLFT